MGAGAGARRGKRCQTEGWAGGGLQGGTWVARNAPQPHPLIDCVALLCLNSGSANLLAAPWRRGGWSRARAPKITQVIPRRLA